MSVDNRLKKIAGMVSVGSTVADIGTDHAYLPVFLVKEGIVSKAFACDVVDGPLENARINILKSGVSGITVRKGDGLNAVKPFEADTFIIAGMGGDLIARILTDSPWIKNEKYELILQPMTAVEDLREYLCRNGFEITLEQAVKSQGRIYTVMKVRFCGKVTDCSPLFYFFGKLIDTIGEDELVYINRKRRIIKELAEDINGIESQQVKYNRLVEAIAEIDKILGCTNGN